MLVGNASPCASVPSSALQADSSSALFQQMLEPVSEEVELQEGSSSKALDRLPSRMPRQNTQFIEENIAGEELKQMPPNMPRQGTQYLESALDGYDTTTATTPLSSTGIVSTSLSSPDLNA